MSQLHYVSSLSCFTFITDTTHTI
ncbi:predicted protein [Fibroporia radiculosa]|uniref:Uncharacterized protein n=1 Tax=Fibroporia radiculosa TaxID=599839 RepID=J7S6N8_9APHY|nr:predicted protein [Fibroporia radiculosa]